VTLVAPGTRIVMILGGGDNVAVLGTEKPSCCQRDLIVIAGTGKDSLTFTGPFPYLNVDLGPGNDSVSVVEGGSALRGIVYTRAGDDVISVGQFTGLSADVDMGDGNDRLFIGHGSGAHGDVTMGFGDDEIELDRATGFEGEIQMGPGDDWFHGDTDDGPSNLLMWTGKDVVDLETGGEASILTGRDDDTVTLRLLDGPVVVDTDHGFDRVHVSGLGLPGGGVGTIDSLTVRGGSHDDVLVLEDIVLASAEFDGGDGFDRYLDIGAIFLSPPVIVDFEGSKVTPGPEAIPPATVVGQISLASGRPVPGATVLLPRFGLVATTDDAGRFRLGPVPMRSGTLEITTGAIVGGRHRTGAGSVVLQPQGDSDAGEIVLGPGRRNVLVFGDVDERTAALEGNLLLLGFQPAEVTRSRALPPDLAPYGITLHVGGDPLDAEQRAQLAAFVQSGGGLLLTGQGPALDTSLAELVNELLGGGTIQLRGGVSSGPHAFNPRALDGLAQRPNALTAFDSGQFSRVLTGAQGANAFVRLQSGEIVGAAWGSTELVERRGRLVLLTSASWVQPGESLDVLENLIAFLQRQPAVVPHR
jgi:hypothetical protein